jgi:hypothetical protein
MPGCAHDALCIVATGDDSDNEVRRDARNDLQWVEVDALGNSLAVETH